MPSNQCIKKGRRDDSVGKEQQLGYGHQGFFAFPAKTIGAEQALSVIMCVISRGQSAPVTTVEM